MACKVSSSGGGATRATQILQDEHQRAGGPGTQILSIQRMYTYTIYIEPQGESSSMTIVLRNRWMLAENTQRLRLVKKKMNGSLKERGINEKLLTS